LDLRARHRQRQQAVDSIDVGVTCYFAPKGRWGGLEAALNYMSRRSEAATVSRVWEGRGAVVSGQAEDVLLARMRVAF
jgi:hypothetical protein